MSGERPALTESENKQRKKDTNKQRKKDTNKQRKKGQKKTKKNYSMNVIHSELPNSPFNLMLIVPYVFFSSAVTSFIM